MREQCAVAALLVMLAACGGGGGNNGGSATTTTVSGKITFDRVPIGNGTNFGGLNFNAVTHAPARGVVVQAVQGTTATGTSLTSTVTDASGNYTLTVPVNTQMIIRADAQMVQTGSGATWNFRVRDNGNAGSLYVLVSSAFNSGTSASTHNLNAASGWGGSSYTGARAAAPFAILDTIYQAQQLILSAQSTIAFPALDLFWSTSNRSSTPFCPSTGNIRTTSFVTAGTGDMDDCSPAQAMLTGIYILGAFSDPTSSDTDEFDQHVIAHEFGHYVEASFSRTDSIGGSHGENATTGLSTALDLRVAFGEGWGNAFSGMVLDNPIYRDSFGTTDSGGFDLDANGDDIKGWYSEPAVGHILWDLFDAGVEPGIDNVQIPFATIFSVMANAQRTTEALTSIFSFSDELINAVPASAQAIDDLLAFESVNGTDQFGTGESDFNGDEFTTPPQGLYIDIAPGTLNARTVCTNATRGVYNKLNNRRFLKLQFAASETHSIVVTGQGVTNGSPDPEVILRKQGQVLAFPSSPGSTETVPSWQFSAGTYIIEVFDSNYGSISGTASSQQRCMTVTVN